MPPARDPATGRFVSSGGGQNMGQAKGTIGVDTSGMATAARDVDKYSTQMGNSTKQINTALGAVAQRFRDAERAAKEFRNSDLGIIQNGLQNAARSMAVVSAGAGLLTLKGVQAAQQIQVLNAKMVIFSGSTEKANQRMAQLRQIAEDNGQAFLDVAEGANAILPAVGRANVDLARTLSLTQRLALLDPAQGIEGAAFAIREALSGEARSLFTRFELPRERVKQAIEDAAGDPQKIIDGLSELIDGIGLTDEKFKELNESGVNAFNRLSGTVREALGTAFTPLLKNFLVPAATGFANFINTLNQTNPQILQMGSLFVLAAAGAAPLLLALSQIINSYRLLKTVSAGGVGGALGRATGIGIAGAAGVGLGVAGAKFLADRGVRSGDLGRVAAGEDPSAILGERVKQLVVILADGIIHLAKVLMVSSALIFNAIDQIVNVFKLGGAALGTVFGMLQEGLGNILVGLADALSGLFDTTAIRQGGQFNQEQGRQRALDSALEGQRAADRLSQGFALPPETMADIDNRIAAVREGILGPLTDLLFPAATETAAAAETAADAMDDVANATNRLSASFEANQEAIEETATKISDLNKDFAEESSRIRQQRAIDAARDRFDFNLQRSRQDRDRARNSAREDIDFFNARQKNIVQHYQSLQEAERQALQQQLKNAEEFRREDLRLAEEHGRKLEEIERETKAAVEDAASRLDARGVQRALDTGSQRLIDENNQFKRQSEERRQQFAIQQSELIENLKAERTQKQSAFEQQLIDELTQRQIQRQREQEDFEIRRADEDEDRKIRLERQAEDFARQDQQRRAAHQRQINDLVSALAAETGIQRQMLNVVVQGMAAAGGTVANFVNYVNRKLAELGQGTSFTAPTGTANGGGLVSPGYTPTFAAGGSPPLNRPVRTNELGMESALINNRMFAMFTQPARIFNAQQTQQLLAGGGGTTLSIGTFSPVFGDIGKRTDADVVNLVKQGLNEFLDAVDRRRRG